MAYQYSDTLAERPAQPNVVSSLVSYQFFEWPSQGNSTVHQSALVSFEFEPVSLAGIRLLPAAGAPMAVVLAFDIPTEAGESYVIEFTSTLSPPAWSVLRPIAGDGHLVTFLVEIPQDAPTRFFRVRRSGGE